MPDELDARIFVSHAGLDWEDDVRPICKELGLVGPDNVTVPDAFIYHDSVENVWAKEIAAALADSTREVVVLLFLSPHSVASSNVADEITVAKQHHLKIVPVMIGQVNLEGTGLDLLLATFDTIQAWNLSRQETCKQIRRAMPKPRPKPTATASIAGDVLHLHFVHPDRVQLGGDHTTERVLAPDRLHRDTLRYLVTRLRRGGLDRATRAEISKLVGMHLYDLVLTAEWRQATAAVRDGGRVELSFDPAREPNDIEGWPWEYLYQWDEQSSGEFVVEKSHGHVVRTLRGLNALELPAVPADQAPQILLCVPRTDLKAIDHQQLFSVLRAGDPLSPAGLRQGVTALTEHTTQAEADAPTEQRVTWRDFRTAIATRRPHVVHFVGAIQQPGEGAELQFAFAHPSGDEPAAWASLSAVARELNGKAHPDSPVGVVVLSVYEPEGDERGGNAGLHAARALAATGIPTVIALPYRAGDDTPHFLGRLYEQVLTKPAAELSADAIRRALSSCRDAHRDDNPDTALYPFGEPVVFLREWTRAQANPAAATQPTKNNDVAGGGQA